MKSNWDVISQQTEVLQSFFFFFFLISGFLRPCAFFFLYFLQVCLGSWLPAVWLKYALLFFVSTLLPSSFSLGRIVSILCLETGCRPATGFSVPCGKIFWTAVFYFSNKSRCFFCLFVFVLLVWFGLFLPTIFHTLSFLLNIFDSPPPFFQLFLFE